MAKLYVIATPIGNLEDVSLRSLKVLSEVGIVVGEDTRTARVLLDHHGVKARLLSYNEHNRVRRIPQILGRLEDGDAALVTDAGTPAISDPGVELVAAAHAAGHEVVTVPGPSAPIAALSIAGLRSATFTFVGFLPRGDAKLRSLFSLHSSRPETLVAFESPERVLKTLQVIAAEIPDRRLAICREMTKVYEEVFSGTAAEALTHFTRPRGEFVLIVEGSTRETQPRTDREAVILEAAEMKRLGLTRQQATPLLTQRHGIKRRAAYEAWLAAGRT